MFQKILIANRGEIAVRIIRACKTMGISTVAVYSNADEDALHTRLADEKICIGPENAAESYLQPERILMAAKVTNADAIHPGFGFLSESSEFVRLCKEYGIVFIGPPAEVIDAMGNKSNARNTMLLAGVPVVPGTNEVLYEETKGKTLADTIGYPVMIKADRGGGGKGMRIAWSEKEFTEQFLLAQSEAAASFSDDTMYIEKYIEHPKHIEVQILADWFGNVVHLGERDCSIQRKHQKIIEESPVFVISKKLQEQLGDSAVKAAKAAGYINAGTIEFLVDSEENYYFMEMNTRIQVEHPVTEAVTGMDLIQAQIEIAAGLPLLVRQEEIVFSGHAIECRINAESPAKNFMPHPGTVTSLHLPGGLGVRVDTALYTGYTIPPLYDSMIAKLIVHGKNRKDAIQRMKVALDELVIAGVETNASFLYSILSQPEFETGEATTAFIEELLKGREEYVSDGYQL